MKRTRSDETTSRWRALCLRLAVITLPALVVGALIGFVPTLALGARVLTATWAPSLVLVGMGAVCGLANGLLARPPHDRLAPAVAVAAGYAFAGFLILRLLVQIRLPPGSTPTILPWVIGGLVVMIMQSIVVALLWRRQAAAS